MRYPKVIVFAAVLALLVTTAGVAIAGGSDSDREKYQEKSTKTETIAPDGRVVVNNISGNVVVKTWDKNDVLVNALKVSRASSLDKAKANAALVPIVVTKTATGLEVKANYPEGNHENLNVSVDFELTIPAKASLDAHTVSGDVTTEKVGGSLKTGTVSGDVTAAGAGKGADLSSVSGDVTVSDVTGDVFAKTISGEVKAQHVAGSINAETVSGGITLTAVTEAKTVTAKALSGDVRYEGAIAKDGRYTFKAHSGEVTVAIPGDSAFEFSAQTFSGDIESEFKMEVEGKLSKKDLHGTVNGGGAVLKLETFSGDINLKKR